MGIGGSKENRGCCLILHILVAVGFGVVLSVFLVGGLAVAEASIWSDEWEYTLDENNNVTLTHYYGVEEEIVLPEKINGHTVVGLQRVFSRNNKITKVIIPDTVTHIEGTFFLCSSLSEIVWSKNLVSIGDDTFYDCSALSEITIPDGVTHIGKNAFAGCSFTEIGLPVGLVDIGDYAFRDCTGLQEIVLPESLKMIGEGAFAYCSSLWSVQFPDTLQSVGEKAFLSCVSLGGIRLPIGLKEISSSAFCRCIGLANIQLEEGNPYFRLDGGILYNADKTEVIMAGSRKMQIARIREGVKRIHPYAFYEYGSIRQMVLPNSLEYIGDQAFYHLGIESITIPGNVTEIGNSILGNCIYLQRLEILGPIEDLHDICSNCHSLTQVSLSEGIRIISGFDSNSLRHISLPESTEVIDYCAFSSTGIVSLSIPAGVVRIEEGALELPNLEKVSVAEGNTYFYTKQDGLYNAGHTLLAGIAVNGTVSISEGCVRIGECAFSEQKTLSKVEIPDTVMEIGREAFYGCQNLTEVCVDNQLRRIGESAFGNNTAFWAESMELEDGVYYWDSYAVSVDKKSKREVLKLRESCTLIADNFSVNNDVLKYLWLPDSMQYIGKDAFFYNKSLKEIIGSGSLKYIGEGAFSENRGLTRILIQGEKVTIETDAFKKCRLSELMIDAEEVALAENCFGKSGATISTLVLPNLNIPLWETGLSGVWREKTKLLLTNMSSETLNQSGALFADCQGLQLYFPFSSSEFAEGDILSGQGVSVFYRDEWHLCRFMVYGAMKRLSILTDGDTVIPPVIGERYYVTPEGPLLENICWDLDGDGTADILPETIHEDIKAEALYNFWEEKHIWRVKEVLQQQNCTQDGDVIYYCSGCGKEKQVRTEALGHDFSLEWTVDREPSCTEMGEKSHHCLREGCMGRTAVTPVIAMGLGHCWDAGVITIEPQAGEEGETTFTCTVCGEQRREMMAALPEQTDTPESSLPVESADPADSLMPGGSAKPQQPESPETSAMPYYSAEPEKSVAPEDSAKPEESKMPQGTRSPEKSVMPEHSKYPEKSAMPNFSVEPEVSLPPQISKSPETSAMPYYSDKPEKSLAPNYSPKPQESRMPDASQGTEKPVLSATVPGFRVKSNYNKITLYWRQSSIGVQYWLYRSEKRNGRKKLMKKLTGNQTSYPDKQVAAGKTYYYQIKVMRWNGSTMHTCGSSHLCKGTLRIRKAPTVQIVKKRRGKIRYLEILIKNYTGKRLEIFYRKRKMGAYRKLKLRSDIITKCKKFRVLYLTNTGNLFFRFRTYRKQGKNKIYSRYTAEKKILVAGQNK